MEFKINVKWSTIILLFAALSIAIYISIGIVAGDTFWIDINLAPLFAGLPDSVNPFFRLLTELGDKKGIGIVAVIFLGWLLVIRRNLVGAASVSLAVALGNELNKFLKELFARPRPELDFQAHVDSLSFPSGHAMVGLVCYYFIAYLIVEALKSTTAKKIVIVSFSLLVLLLGASRIILQVHYPTDVIGGYAFGYIWVILWIFIYNYTKSKLSKRG